MWPPRDPAAFGQKAELSRFLSQIEDEGYARSEQDNVVIGWEELYRLMESPYAESVNLLELPPMADWRPVLESVGSLTDPDFMIVLAGWRSPNGRRAHGNPTITGAILKVDGTEILLSKAVWETVAAVSMFHRSRAEQNKRDADWNRRAWAAVRTKAHGTAILSNFLANTVVLTPEKLDINLRKHSGTGSRGVEVIPGFAEQPRRWLELFDRIGTVLDRYEIPDDEGMAHVLVSPEVQTVLREIKRMPGRRVAGDRAEAFLRNPFATLGPVATEVIDPEQFEHAREMAGISFTRFTARVNTDENGHPVETALSIEESIGGNVRVTEYPFEGVADLREFINKIDAKMKANAQCCHWKGFDLEILGDTPDQVEMLRHALAGMGRGQRITKAELLDLSRYSERIERFGIEKLDYSPFIARSDKDGGWIPESIQLPVLYTPEGGGKTVPVKMSGEELPRFREAVARARVENQDTFTWHGCPEPLPTAWAEGVLGPFNLGIDDIYKRSVDPDRTKAGGQAGERQSLIIKPNVNTLDYEEKSDRLVCPDSLVPRLPVSLKPEVVLKEHQRKGVAWLQCLWSQSPRACRGALLADDMGLGKTIQLLTFMAALLEENPQTDPFLVIAPVSLLENWKEEIDKFFKTDTFSVLTLYGADLTQKRVPAKEMDPEVVRDGITRLLRKDWLGEATLVLTTYETLRDLEISLAGQQWSVIICDEAQKIKNPNAMVTRAAKKQNARFKIACTGTPVENTLVDLWCLFDFIQPGLLKALKDFGERYRRPVEAATGEEKERVEELRKHIKPQTLRRMKVDVANDLPKKIEMADCRSLPISNYQRRLYAETIDAFRKIKLIDERGAPNHLGLLHYLRRLCSDPRPPGTVATDGTSLDELLSRSPKMSWLMRQLESIKKQGEKAIVFCELRDVQRLLQRVISKRFDCVPDMINGETSVASKNANNRQRRIKAFQEKSGFGVIILSPLVVGYGVNIQEANHVIHFTRPWNPAREDQATDRAFRIGQRRDVFVYYPTVVANDFLTFDANLNVLLERKRDLSKDMLNGAEDLKFSDFSNLGVPEGGVVFEDEPLTAMHLESFDGDAFEAFCAILWSKQGYAQTQRTPKFRDGGIDVVAVSGKKGVLIQCKSSSIGEKELGWEAVKDVVAGRAAYLARHPGVEFSLFAVTNRRFNQTALAQARLNQVELIDGTDLALLLKKHPVRRSELDSYMFEGWDRKCCG
ncbi:MAG: restriction endonuclease [Magnetococcales bacterium]|nr:restriction endonuclease [Magnetococcales bacterium]